MELNTLSILADNKFGVLTKVATLFSGRGVNIYEMTARATEEGYSRITIDVLGETEKVKQILGQLGKLEVVKDVSIETKQK